MKRILCIGNDIGGMRLGLEARGLTAKTKTLSEALSTDFHLADELTSQRCDGLCVLMPTAPFEPGSTGGTISGPLALREVLKASGPLESECIVIYGRKSLLSERFGTTFAEILLELSLRQYSATWGVVNLSWLGLPHDAYRVIVLAEKGGSDLETCSSHDVPLLRHLLGPLRILRRSAPQSLRDLIDKRKPRIGLQAPEATNPFGNFGIMAAGVFVAGLLDPLPVEHKRLRLAQVLGIESEALNAVCSVRFTSRNGRRGLQLKRDGLAHAIGPAISAWPLLAAKREILNGIGQPPSDSYNWRRSVGEYEVFRITPSRALLLFGVEAAPLMAPLSHMGQSISEQYRVVSETVPPVMASRLATAISLNNKRESRGKNNEVHKSL